MQIAEEQTLPAGTFSDEPTLPVGLKEKTEQEPGNFPVLDGTLVGEWRVLSSLRRGPHTALYLAQGMGGQADTVIKLYEVGHPVHQGALRRLMLLRTPGVLPLLGYGRQGEYPYEVFPLMTDGSLKGRKLSEETVIQIVLPQLEQALFQLHQAKLLHNDVKPENLLWKERDKQMVLGDFGNVCGVDDREKVGGTLAYMAPEMVFSGGTVHTPASDYCAMGLTLIALLTGASPLANLSEKQVRRCWQRGIHCQESISPRLANLLQDLVRYDPRQRPDHEKIRRWLEREGAVTVQRQRPPDADRPVGRQHSLRPLHFKNRILLDIQELIAAAAQDWEYAAFLLQQHQLNDFLIQFSPNYYQLCEQCAQIFDADEGLFRLLQSISPSKAFCWCGQNYRDLEDFAQKAAAATPLQPGSAPVRFLRLGLLDFYLKKNDGTAEQRCFAVELQRRAQEDPDLAITQLLITMSAHPEFQWHGQTFCTIGDVATWLLQCEEDLDHAVEELYQSKQFEAWLNFIQCGRFLPEVKNKMQEVSL